LNCCVHRANKGTFNKIESMKKIVLSFFLFANMLQAQQKHYTFDKPIEKEKVYYSPEECTAAILSYYTDYKTGTLSTVQENGISITRLDSYTAFTDNYVVEIKGCYFKMSYDVYDVPNSGNKHSVTIQLRFGEVKNLKKGKNDEANYKDGSIESLNRNIVFQMIKKKKIQITEQFGDQITQKLVSEYQIKIVPTYDAYPNQKHPDFKEDMMVNYFNGLITYCKK
jgi:hypothetical protein